MREKGGSNQFFFFLRFIVSVLVLLAVNLKTIILVRNNFLFIFILLFFYWQFDNVNGIILVRKTGGLIFRWMVCDEEIYYDQVREIEHFGDQDRIVKTDGESVQM